MIKIIVFCSLTIIGGALANIVLLQQFVYKSDVIYLQWSIHQITHDDYSSLYIYCASEEDVSELVCTVSSFGRLHDIPSSIKLHSANISICLTSNQVDCLSKCTRCSSRGRSLIFPSNSKLTNQQSERMTNSPSQSKPP